MQVNNKKKGFTLVELVIVIAVIAVLAAIMIPTFNNIIQKANESNDTQIIRNLNEALAIDNTEHSTMYDVLQVAEEAGFKVKNINARARNNKILWDSVNDVFVYLVDNTELRYITDGVADSKKLAYNDYRLWCVSEEVSTTYSTYYTGKETVINTTKGFDAGSVESIVTINYTNPSSIQNAVIRTNSGALNIQAKSDSVTHYGNADSINIIDIASSSYHEKGTVKFLEISAGHVVLEEAAKVKAVHFTATGSGENAKFENNNGKKISIDLSKVDEEGISFSRDAVIIQENGTYVAEVKTDSTEYIWLFGNGIKEQMVVTESKGTIAENGELKSGIEVGAEDGSVAEQIANPAKRNSLGQLVAEDGETVVTPEEAVIEEIASKEDVSIGQIYFAGGTGSENDPFLIIDYNTFQNISNFYDKGYYNFKVREDIQSIDCKNWRSVFLQGNFDGSGALLYNLDMGLFDCAEGDSSTIKNFTINANISRSGGIGAVVYDSNTLNLTIESVEVHGTIIGANWVTPFVEFGPGPSSAWNLTIRNCISDATLVATSGTASGFVGHPYDDVSNGSINGKSLITIIDSAFIGNMSATGDPTKTNYYGFKYFTINGNNNRVKTYYSDAFIEKLGYNPEGILYNIPVDGIYNKGKADETECIVICNNDGSKTFLCGNYGVNVVDHYKPLDKKARLNTESQTTLPANIGDVFTIKKVSGATKAVISLQIAPNDKNNYGSYLGTYLSEEIDISGIMNNSVFTTETIKYFVINVNSGVTTKTGISGNIFNVVNPYYGKNAHNGASVKIAQFDANGNVLNITSIEIAKAHKAE